MPGNCSLPFTSSIERVGCRWLWRRCCGAPQGHSWGQFLTAVDGTDTTTSDMVRSMVFGSARLGVGRDLQPPAATVYPQHHVNELPERTWLCDKGGAPELARLASMRAVRPDQGRENDERDIGFCAPPLDEGPCLSRLGSSSITITSGGASIWSTATASATVASAVVSKPASPKADNYRSRSGPPGYTNRTFPSAPRGGQDFRAFRNNRSLGILPRRASGDRDAHAAASPITATRPRAADILGAGRPQRDSRATSRTEPLDQMSTLAPGSAARRRRQRDRTAPAALIATLMSSTPRGTIVQFDRARIRLSLIDVLTSND